MGDSLSPENPLTKSARCAHNWNRAMPSLGRESTDSIAEESWKIQKEELWRMTQILQELKPKRQWRQERDPVRNKAFHEMKVSTVLAQNSSSIFSLSPNNRVNGGSIPTSAFVCDSLSAISIAFLSIWGRVS
jgi:hypothetical protein